MTKVIETSMEEQQEQTVAEKHRWQEIQEQCRNSERSILQKSLERVGRFLSPDDEDSAQRRLSRG